MAETFEHIVLNWLKNNPLVFRHRQDRNILTLIELASQKQISLDLSAIENFRIAENKEGFGTYINLVLPNGNELVLCHVGFAFAPSFQNTGPIQDAPPVVSMTDYFNLKRNLEQLLQEPDRKMEIITLFHVLISFLDGAKLIGLEVEYEEEALEKQLSEFESQF